MPLLVPSAITPPIDPPTDPGPGGGTPAAAVSSTTTLIDPAGKTWYLSDGSMGIWCEPGRRGFHAPGYAFFEDASPAVDGAFFRGVRAGVRELFQPLFFGRSSRVELTELRRGFVAATSPKRGECQLTVTQPDDTRRHIDVWRGEGMEGEEGPGEWGVTCMRYGLVLRALDPFWYGDDETKSWQGAASQTFFPLPHSSSNFVNLLPSQVLGTTTADNVGDVEAYPRWDITGPATAITVADTTTGKTLTLSATLAGSSNRRIIDTRPGRATVVDESGANKWAELADGSSLWTLQPGTNELTVSVTGSTTATRATMTYRPRFEGV